MPDQHFFSIVLVAVSFLSVGVAVVIAIMIESVGFRRRYRLRRHPERAYEHAVLAARAGLVAQSGLATRRGPLRPML